MERWGDVGSYRELRVIISWRKASAEYGCRLGSLLQAKMGVMCLIVSSRLASI